MKAILKFNLDDADDRMSHKQCVHANDMAIILWELVYNSHKTIENKIESQGGNKKVDAYTAINYWHERLTDLLEEYSIDINELCV